MFKQIADLNVHYDVQGQGYPLVLLHGGGSRSSSFEEMVPILARDFTVYTYDQRGFGDTERPADVPLAHDLWRDDLGRFMETMGLERAAVCGWSLGGGVALHFALTYPRKVSHLVLIGAMSPRLEPTDRSGFSERLRLIESGAKPEEIVAKTFDFTKKAFSPYSIEHNPAAVEKIRQEHLHNNPQSYLEMVQANQQRPEIGSRLGEVRCPTLLIVGEHDGRTPVEHSEDLNKTIPLSYLKIIPNCGHFYGYEQPEAVSHAMSTFLKTFSAFD